LIDRYGRERVNDASLEVLGFPLEMINRASELIAIENELSIPF
jgi:hypothetical protein